MREPAKILRDCFTDQEWAWLFRQAEFQEAIKDMKGLDDVERLSALGDRLILQRKIDGGRLV